MEWIGAVGAAGSALISGIFIMIAARLRRENSDQHSANQVKMEAIGEDVREVKVDVRAVRDSHTDHLKWHAER